MKSLLRYPGGKTRALKHITPYFPKNLTEIVSPFFGGGSIEIHYASQGVRVYGYEIFEPLVNFWQHVLDDPEEIGYLLETLFHPCSKEMFAQYQKKQGWTHMDSTHMKWKEYRACMYYALNRSSFSGATTSGGYSQQAADKRFTESSRFLKRLPACSRVRRIPESRPPNWRWQSASQKPRSIATSPPKRRCSRPSLPSPRTHSSHASAGSLRSTLGH